jgi:cobalt-zinc-cadmium efflux system outer membrane protein
VLTKRLIYGFGSLLIGAAPLLAQVRLTPADPVADRLVAEALQKTPEIRSATANVEAAQRRIVPARTLPDPSASFTYQNDGRGFTLGSAEGTFAGFMLSQALPWPGKLSLAGRIAESEAREIAGGSLSRAQRTIEARVRNAWYDLLLAKSVDRVIEERRATATQIEASARERYGVGLAVQQDVLRAQIELVRIDELKANQRALIVSRAAELNRLTGRPQDASVESPSDLPAPAAVPAADPIISSVVAHSPEVASARQGIETGRFAVDFARKNFLPDFVVSGGSMYRGSFEMGPMWQAGVTVSIPAWLDRRQRNQLAEAEARLDARNADADLVPQQLELRTRERLAQLAASDEIAALYRDKVLPLDELSLESAMASYTAAKVPFITVLEALNALYSDRTAYRSRLAESAKWRVAIDEASLDPTAMSGSPAMPAAGGMSAGGSPAGSAPRSSSSNKSSMTSMR